jgi:hypothetical protein
MQFNQNTILSNNTTLKQSVVSGSTYQLGLPISRQVRAYSRANGMLINSTRSDNTGFYKMYLPIDMSYTIISIDKNKIFNAVIQDNVVPK